MASSSTLSVDVDVEQAPVAGLPAPAAPADTARPSAQDLLSSRRSRTVPQRAREGWRGWLVHEVGLPLAPSKAEKARHELTTTVQTQLPGPRTVMVVNPKGGVGKTTTTLLLSAALGLARGGGVVAWDNNETRGTMGLRSRDAGHGGTVRSLLAAAPDLTSTAGRLGDLDAHVHHQRGVRFDVLRSDEDPTGAGVVDADDFAALHTLIQRFYRLVVVDTGNNIRSANWQAAAAAADQLVITTTVREDSGASAAWMVDALAAGPHAHLLERAVTVLSDPSPRTPEDERKRLTDHFAAATGGDSARVVRVPFDRALTGGGVIDHDLLSSPTRTAWLRVAAAVIDQLAAPSPAAAVPAT
jgi:MinD-like ATPase involved in chromosome partitioning or flagellar assembly